MLARAAENLYWMARYLERAENTARLINSTTHVLLDLPHGATFGWATLIEIAGLDNLFHKNHPDADEDAIMHFLIADTSNPSSLLSCIQYARENTRTLREMLPAEMWERINSLYLYLKEHAPSACRSRRERYMVLNAMIEQRHAIVGLVSGVMEHSMEYQIIKLGRNIERADMTTRILDLNSAVRFPADSELHEALMERVWMSTLNSLSAYQTYRRSISMHVRRGEVIRFLLRDMRFPRSVAHCLNEIESCFKLLPLSQQLQQLSALLQHQVSHHHSFDLDTISLHEYLDTLQAKLGDIHNALTQHYFQTYQNAGTAAPHGGHEIQFAEQ